MKLRTVAVALIALVAVAPVAVAEPSAGFNAVVLPGDIAFGAGGMNARYLILEDWAATTDYGINSFVKHSNQVWVAISDPAVGDTPGTAAAWLQITGTGGGSGSSTFLGLTDTPGSYTGADMDIVRVNADGNALEFVNEPVVTNSIPQVGRIPTVSDSSPVLIFLTHDEIGGSRDDATLTVARDGTWCGYSDGSVFGTFGAISETSPITTLLGIWDPDNSDCTLSEVYTTNDGWLDTQATIVGTVSGSTFSCNLGVRYQNHGHFVKRITSCTALEDIALGDITINFLDGSSPAVAYWNDGELEHRAGLYEKVGMPPVYHDLAPPEDAHKTGEGSAACGESEPPDAAGQICVTSDGRGYFAMPRTSLVTTAATISVAGVSSDSFISDLYEANDLETRNNLNDGDFIYIKTTQEFYQYQDPDFEVVTWMEAWQYVIDNVGDTPARQTFLASTFLGEFASESEVLLDRDGYTDDTVEYYFLYSDFGTLIQITAFTNSVRETISEGFAWRGPVIIPEEVLDVVSANPTGAIDEPLDSLLIGSQRYSVIVRPGANGQLRDPTAADYDEATARSKVVAVIDGLPYKVGRILIDGHTAAGTFTEITSGSDLDDIGEDYTFRGVHYYDGGVSSPHENDIYYDLHNHRWRRRVHDPYLGAYWQTLTPRTGILADWDYVGWFPDQETSLAHATGNDQLFITTPGTGSGGYGLFELSGFTAAAAAHYEHNWVPAASPAITPTNDVLVDDLVLTWTDAGRPSRAITFSRALTELDDGRPIITDFVPNAQSATARDVGDLILAERVRTVTEQRPVRLVKDGGGGGDPIDLGAAIPDSGAGFVHLYLPLSSGDRLRHRATLLYIGDHITDLNEDVTDTETEWDVDATTDLVSGREYWVAGATASCTSNPHFEKIRIVSVDDADTITVTRGVDNTGLPESTCVLSDGADIIEDDKRTFTLASSHADQDSAQITFTLLAQGIGGFGSGSAGNGDLETEQLGSAGSLTLPANQNWVATGISVASTVHVILADASTVNDSFAIVDWDTIRGGTAGTIGSLAATGEYHTFEAHVGATTSLVRIGHDGNGQILLAADAATELVVPRVLIERLVAPVATSMGSDNGGVTRAADVEYTADVGGVIPGGTGNVQTALDRLDDHAMGRITDSTLRGTGESSDPLMVEINDVIEHLQEDVRYYTDSTNYSERGATVGHTYNTSPYQKTITKIRADIDPPGENHTYYARIYEITSSSNDIVSKMGTSDAVSVTGSAGHFYFHFRDGGVNIPASTKIAIVLSRTGAGSDAHALLRSGGFADGSPQGSYNDADDDFEIDNWVEYTHTDPDVGQSTEQHGSGDAYGNIKIYYSVTYHHSAFVGTTPNAASVSTVTTDFDGHLSSADTNVQAALETLDDVDAEDLDIAGLPDQSGFASNYDFIISAAGTNRKAEIGAAADFIASIIDDGTTILNTAGELGVPDRALVPAKINPTGSTAGQVVVSTGPSSDPEWQTQAAAVTLTEEEVEDYVGGMVTGNTETRVTVTYDDTDGTLDFVVDEFLPLAGGSLTGQLNVATSDNTTPLNLQCPSCGNQTVVSLMTNTTGQQKAFQAIRMGEGNAWASFEGALGGNNDNPGFSLGTGGAGRDVELVRGGANLLATPDDFRARSLNVLAAGLADTKTNLDIPEDFTDLDDTPATIAADQCVMGNSAGDALEFGACGTGGGTTVTANPTGVTSATTRLDSVAIGGTNYNAAHVVLPDATTGVLRAAAATDWNATAGESRVLAFDGQDIYRVGRFLVGAHTASATFTTVASGTVIDSTDTEDCTWRGFHHSDYAAIGNNPAVGDCYYNTTNQKWRWYYSNGWFDVTSYVIFEGLTYLGLFNSETAALAHVTGNGQYVAYTNAMGAHVLTTTSAFVAGADGHYEYEWVDADAGLAPDVANGAPNVTPIYNSITSQTAADAWHLFDSSSSFDADDYSDRDELSVVVTNAAGVHVQAWPMLVLKAQSFVTGISEGDQNSDQPRTANMLTMMLTANTNIAEGESATLTLARTDADSWAWACSEGSCMTNLRIDLVDYAY